MLSPVLLLKPPKHHHFTPVLETLHHKIPEWIEYKVISLIYNTLLSPSIYVSCSRSNHILQICSSFTIVLLCNSVASSLTFANRYKAIHVAVPPLWKKLSPVLRRISDRSCQLSQTLALAICPQLFHYKLKTLFYSKSYPDSSSSSYLPPLLNSKHHPHSCLIVCLHACLPYSPILTPAYRFCSG